MLSVMSINKDWCTWRRTDGMSREKWLELRKSGIGGSDAGAIMGLNRYSSPLTVYFSKKGDVPQVENAKIHWGHVSENAIRRETARRYGLKARKMPYMFRSIKNPFMIADLDGLVMAETETDIEGVKVQGVGGLEIKTTTHFNGEFTGDEIPDSYYAQVQHYMAVTGLSWFILAVMIDKVGGRVYVVPRNEGFIEQLIERERVFWNEFVMTDTPPAPTGIEREMEIIGTLPTAESVEIDASYSDLLDERAAIEAQIKELEKKSAALKESVLLAIAQASGNESAEKTTAVCNEWRISYNTQTRKSADVKALEKDGLTNYIKTSSSRVARFTRIKA